MGDAMADWLITNVRLIDADGEREGSLRTAGGRIAEVLPAEGLPAEGSSRTGRPAGAAMEDLTALAARHGCRLLDGRGRWLVPGGVDPHVHLGLRSGDARTVDDFASGTRAALAGGTTTVIDFVTPTRQESLVAATGARLAETVGSSCDFHLHASITAWRPATREEPGTAAELRRCVERFGHRSLKLYLAYLETIGLAGDHLAAAMAAAADLDLTVLLHCEDGAEVSRRRAELVAAGDLSPAAHARSRPPEVEVAAVRTALALAARTGCRPYLVHLSTADALAAVAAAREQGQAVWAETCPQYLLLDASAYARPAAEAALLVMSPPLRDPEHGVALRAALASGAVDVVGTDHCAFSRAQKQAAADHFPAIPNGVAGVAYRLTLLHTHFVAAGLISPSRWVELVAAGPARAFGLCPRKGSLAVGADADLVLWDPEHRGVIHAGEPPHPSDHTVYEGWPVVGRAERVWLRGESVVEDGAVVAGAGRGRFLGRDGEG